jgi:hypothetical protein
VWRVEKVKIKSKYPHLMAALSSQDTRGVGDFHDRGLYSNWTLNRKEDEIRSEIR